jgi:pimeloyl-ACP methyl ester carboxylesterase
MRDGTHMSCDTRHGRRAVGLPPPGGRAVRRLPFAAIAVLAIAAVSISHHAALAAQIPGLPRAFEQILESSGVLQSDAAARLLGDWQAALRPPVRNAEFADLMERARREDVVIPLTHNVMAPEMVSAGLWHSQFFVDNYGSALFLAAPFVPDRMPVVLIHGINGSPRNFADLTPELQRMGYQPVYFFYPSGMALDDAARQLAMRVQEFLHRHEPARLAIVGHSMGGLVGKGLLDQVDVADTLPPWRVFVSISSPFAGIASAQYAERLPRRPPAWDDLAPQSAFMQKIGATDFPSELAFYLFFSARSDRGMMTPFGNNDGVLTVDSMVRSPVTDDARDVFGFYEDHTSILSAALVFRRLNDALAAGLEQ